MKIPHYNSVLPGLTQNQGENQQQESRNLNKNQLGEKFEKFGYLMICLILFQTNIINSDMLLERKF